MYWKQIVRTMIVLALTCQPGFAQTFAGIHCGSDEAYVSPRGDAFADDQPYSAERGYGYIGGVLPGEYRYELVGGREDVEPLYRRVREGEFSYRFDLPNGLYAVKLMLGDLIMHGPGFRSMNAAANGSMVVEDLDLCAEVGHSFAWPVRFAVEVDNGRLELTFGSTLGGATCSAIAVREIEADAVPPATLSGITAIGGYEMNIVYWDFCAEDDLGYYRVYRRNAGEAWAQVTNDSYPLYRYLDYDVDVGSEYEYRASAVDLWGNESEPTEIVSASPVMNASTDLARMQLFVSDESLYELNEEYWSTEDVDAALVAEGQSFPNSGLRFRGNYTRQLSKKNYKVSLPAGQLYRGQDRINLSSEMIDYSMLKNRVSTTVYGLLTPLNPEIRDVHLEINNEFRGVYLELENIDNHFLERRGLSTAGNLYSAESNLQRLPNDGDYQWHYFKENNQGSGWQDICDFTTWLDTASAGQFKCKAAHRFAVDQFLDMYTGIIATAEWDWGGHNYYLYHNPVDRKWYFIPWDHNTSLGDADSPIDLFTAEHPSPVANYTNCLVERLLAEPLFQYAYCKKLERFLETEFSVDRMQQRIQTAYDAIYYDAVRDVYKNGWERYHTIEWGPGSLNSFVEQRVAYLQSELPGFIADPDRGPEFRLNEVMAVNESVIQDEAGDFDPWVELVNVSPVELDLSGFTLSLGSLSWVMTDEVVIPAAGRLLLWLDGEPAEGATHANFTLTNAGGALQLIGSHGTRSDSTMLPELAANVSWARRWDNWGEWRDDMEPTPGEPNSPPADPSPLRVNELLALNNHTLPDEAGQFEDWIEIYNPADYAIPLVGLYLSDNSAQPLTWAFPDTMIEAGGFVPVWCDEDPEEGPLHATFKLSGDGEAVYLTDRNGTTPIDQVQFPAQTADISYGRYPDGENQWIIMEPTPGRPNVTLAVEESPVAELPLSFALHQNYPNPFNPSTTIRFDLAERSIAKLTIYDIMGRTVAELVNREMVAGEHAVVWNAESVASGIYFYRLQAGKFADVKKMAVVK